MENKDKENFGKLMASLAELYNRKLSTQLISIYWHVLKDYQYADVQNSLNNIIRDPNIGQFMPKPADIVRFIDGDNTTVALAAWTKVMYAIRTVGGWDSVKFDDPKIHAVINDMGGWVEMCRFTTKELNFLAREFESRYLSYKYKANIYSPPKLIGKLEQQYHHGSSANIETKFIGVSNESSALSKLGHQKN